MNLDSLPTSPASSPSVQAVFFAPESSSFQLLSLELEPVAAGPGPIQSAPKSVLDEDDADPLEIDDDLEDEDDLEDDDLEDDDDDLEDEDEDDDLEDEDDEDEEDDDEDYDDEDDTLDDEEDDDDEDEEEEA